MSDHLPPRRVRRSPRLNPDGLEGQPNLLSAGAIVDQFEQFCGSKSLSLDLLEEWLGVIGEIGSDVLDGSPFLHHVCLNENVTLEIVERLLDFYPGAANISSDAFCEEHEEMSMGVVPVTHAYPLHLACYNECCSGSVLRLLVEKSRGAVLSHMCRLFQDGVECEYEGRACEGPVHGTPLHYLLNRSAENIEADAVKAIVEACPEALVAQDDISKYAPIHVLARNPQIDALYPIMEYMITFQPSSLRLKEGYDDTPLHSVCMNEHITVRIVRLILDAWPAATRQRNNCGHSPLISLCDCESKEIDVAASVEVLLLLLEFDPESVSRRCNDDELPIHFAAKSRPAEFCQALVQAYPESIRDGGHSRTLPIHEACAGVDPATVKFLYEKYPESILARSDGGRLPIHEAAGSVNASCIEIIDFLLEHDRDGTSRAVSRSTWTGDADKEGMLPLHLACQYQRHPELVKHLFDVYPEAINTKDRNGNLPYDVARSLPDRVMWEYFDQDSKSRHAEVVAFLQTQMNYARLANDSWAMVSSDDRGRLPLHKALCSGVCLGAVKMLVKGYTRAVGMADKDGMLPLHLACQSSPVGVVKFLVERYEEALGIKGPQNDTALHHACRVGNCEVVKYLLEKRVASVSVRNADELLPIHLLCDSSNKRWGLQDTPLYLEVTWRLLLAHPEAVVKC